MVGQLLVMLVFLQQGIFQGDSLSSLLFVLALMPLTFLLHQSGKGYGLQDYPIICYI